MLLECHGKDKKCNEWVSKYIIRNTLRASETSPLLSLFFEGGDEVDAVEVA